MKKQAFVMAAALGLVLAVGSAQAGGLESDNGVQLNGIAASGFAVETVELPDGTVVERKAGGDPN